MADPLHFGEWNTVQNRQKAGWAPELAWKFWGKEKYLLPLEIKIHSYGSQAL